MFDANSWLTDICDAGGPLLLLLLSLSYINRFFVVVTVKNVKQRNLQVVWKRRVEVSILNRKNHLRIQREGDYMPLILRLLI